MNYVFIDESCSADPDFLKIYENGEKQAAKFALESFTFDGMKNEIFIHCEVS